MHQNLSIKDPEMPMTNPMYELSAVLESAVSISKPVGNGETTASSSSKGGKRLAKSPRDYELAVNVHASAATRASLQRKKVVSLPPSLSKSACSGSATASDDVDISEEYEYVSSDGKELFLCTPAECKQLHSQEAN